MPRPAGDLDDAQSGATRKKSPARIQESRISRLLIEFLRPIRWLILKSYLRIEVVNGERIPKTGPVILVPTHRSRWDGLVVYSVSRRLPRYLVSHDEFIGLQGWCLSHSGAFPVNTQRPSAGVLRHCQELLLKGEMLAVFPEGTIFYYPPNQVHPLKPGVAWLALSCQRQLGETPVVIVPLRIVYEHRHPKRGTRVQLVVGEPIDPRSYQRESTKDAIRDLTADIQSALGDVVNDSLEEMSTPRAPRPNPHAS